MHRYDHHIELFSEESVPTEATAYRLLRDRPLEQPATYLAAPWSVLIKLKSLDVPKVRFGGGFTICQHVWYEQIIPCCLQLGIDTLYTPHVPRGFQGLRHPFLQAARRLFPFHNRLQDRCRAVRQFRILPFPHLAVNSVAPQRKDIWYSFIGAGTHSTRRAIFRLPKRRDTFIARRDRWHFQALDARQQVVEKQQYQDVLARSRFSLCPRGFGASTIRFWESLQAGAIPVLIADAMALPEGFDWDDCMIRIPERDSGQLESKLREISPQREQQLRQKCFEAHQRFQGENLVSCIREDYQSRRQAA